MLLRSYTFGGTSIVWQATAPTITRRTTSRMSHSSTSSTSFSHFTTSTSHTSSTTSSPFSSSSPTWRRRLLSIGVGVGLTTAATAVTVNSLTTPTSPNDTQPRVLLSTVACSAATRPSSDWPPPLMTPARIYATLASKEEKITPVQRGRIREYHVNQYQANPVIEDTIAIVPTVQGPTGGFLAGVFDGHSGKAASQWCSEELLPYLQYYRWSNRTDQLIHKRTFIEADHHFLELALRDKRINAGLSGACLNVAHICGQTVRTANAGDCRTIVGKRVPRPTSDPSAPQEYKYQAVELTTDHQIDTNHLERERLLRDHPDESDIIQRNRVKGRLQPTRGFGDGFYKRKEYYLAKTISRPYLMFTPPYTTVEPDITSYDLQPEDDFLIMASDGLFQDLNSQQVVEYVGEWMALQAAETARVAKSSFLSFGAPAVSPAYCKNASTYLIKQSLTHASEHAVGRRRKPNENLSWIMQLPADKKRDYHDDISVIVVFFDHQSKYPSDAPPPSASATDPPVPPTLSRALALHLKPPPTTLVSTLPTNDGTTPIKIAPIQNEGSAAATPAAAPAPTPAIRSNL